jgi:NADPH:quinone reductase-like Zn-dependent oxidoreductase
MSDHTMRAVRFHAYGGPEQLVLEQVPRPEPQAGEVLVRVYAAGVNPIDWKIRKGFFKNERPVPLPFTPGSELAGTVEQLGPDVTGFAIGQAVYGRGAKGAYADYAVIVANQLSPMPSNINFDQAASVPVGASTAWLALFSLANLQTGQKVLVHGAAGGVGNYAVQLARWKDAHVIGTASSRNQEFVHTLGAETVIDYSTTPFEQVVHEVDVVVDPLGGEVQDRSWPLLKPGGILVAIGHLSAEKMAAKYGVRTASTVLAQRVPPGRETEPLQEISALIESEFLLPQVGNVFSLQEAAQAQAEVETGHGRGRMVLHIANE